MGSSNLSAVAEVIPQLSYEIVGRIIPGIIVIFSLFLAAMGPSEAAGYLDAAFTRPDPALSGWAVLLLIIAAYILAFVLDGLWQIPALARRRSEKHPQPDLEAPSTSFKFDVVNQEFPTQGAWLTKLYAETNTTQVLIIGWIVSAVVNAGALLTGLSIERLWLEIGLIVGMVGAVAVRNSIAAARDASLENLWTLYQKRTSVKGIENAAGDVTDR